MISHIPHAPRLEILCDLDEITADLFGKWLRVYNQEHNDNLDKNKVTWKGLHKESKIGQDIYKYLHLPGFFADLDPIPGAIAALKEFHDDGHEITILSAPSYPGTSALDKMDWIQKHLPFIHKRDVLLGWHKHKVRGHVLIDDSPENIANYRRAWPESNIYTIAYNHNQDVRHLTDVYALDCNDTEAAWKTIRQAVKYLEEARKKKWMRDLE